MGGCDTLAPVISITQSSEAVSQGLTSLAWLFCGVASPYNHWDQRMQRCPGDLHPATPGENEVWGIIIAK